MIVPEDYAKRLLLCYGIRTPPGRAAHCPAEAAAIAQELGGAGVVKALIPTGGRGKAGGVKLCQTADEVQSAAASIIDSLLLGHKVSSVLVEQAVPISREIYVGVVANCATGMVDLILSLAGGMDIETMSQKDNNAVLRLAVEPGDVLPVHRVRRWLREANLEDVNAIEVAEVLVALYRASADLDAMLLEVNPLAVAQAGSLIALDCKLEVDDNALVRQPELLELYQASLSERELRARELGVSFVPLDGDIGVITSGAGLGMATLDLLKRAGLEPANFLDTGGGISEALVKGSLELIMEFPQMKGAIINLYGGINRMLEAAKGIVAALENIGSDRPIVAKIIGNQQEEAWAMLEQVPCIHVVRVVQTEAAVSKLRGLVG